MFLVDRWNEGLVYTACTEHVTKKRWWNEDAGSKLPEVNTIFLTATDKVYFSMQFFCWGILASRSICVGVNGMSTCLVQKHYPFFFCVLQKWIQRIGNILLCLFYSFQLYLFVTHTTRKVVQTHATLGPAETGDMIAIFVESRWIQSGAYRVSKT